MENNKNIFIEKDEIIKTDKHRGENIIDLTEEYKSYSMYIKIEGAIFKRWVKTPVREDDYLKKLLKKDNIDIDDFLRSPDKYIVDVLIIPPLKNLSIDYLVQIKQIHPSDESS